MQSFDIVDTRSELNAVLLSFRYRRRASRIVSLIVACIFFFNKCANVVHLLTL